MESQEGENDDSIAGSSATEHLTGGHHETDEDHEEEHANNQEEEHNEHQEEQTKNQETTSSHDDGGPAIHETNTNLAVGLHQEKGDLPFDQNPDAALAISKVESKSVVVRTNANMSANLSALGRTEAVADDSKAPAAETSLAADNGHGLQPAAAPLGTTTLERGRNMVAGGSRFVVPGAFAVSQDSHGEVPAAGGSMEPEVLDGQQQHQEQRAGGQSAPLEAVLASDDDGVDVEAGDGRGATAVPAVEGSLPTTEATNVVREPTGRETSLRLYGMGAGVVVLLAVVVVLILGLSGVFDTNGGGSASGMDSSSSNNGQEAVDLPLWRQSPTMIKIRREGIFPCPKSEALEVVPTGLDYYLVRIFRFVCVCCG